MKLLSFSGRASRTEFWLVLIISVVILVIIDKFTKPLLDKYEGWWNAPIIIAILIPFFWVNIATEVRRLHDMGQSGFWAFIQIIPIVGALIALIWFGFFEGNNEDNKYGAKLPNFFSQLEE